MLDRKTPTVDRKTPTVDNKAPPKVQPKPLPKPAVRRNKLDALQHDPHTFFRFCNLHTTHRPKLTMTPIGQQAETKMMFLIKAVKTHHLDHFYWACFFTLIDGEFSDWGYSSLSSKEVRRLGDDL
jgi:hypothetical protein